MAGVQFQVDAILSSNSATNLQQQINNITTKLNLTINNTEALRSIQAVQDKINNLQRSMNNMSLNVNANGSNVGGQGGSSRSKGRSAQFETETLARSTALYKQISNTVKGTVKDIKVLRDTQGKIVGGTIKVADSTRIWARNLEFVDGKFKRIGASGKDTISFTQKSNELYAKRIKHLSNISNIKTKLLTATGEERKVLQQQLQDEQRRSKLVANQISRKNSSGVAMYQTKEGEQAVAEHKTRLAQQEALAQARVKDSQAVAQQTQMTRQQNQMYSQQSNLIKQIGQTERAMVGTTGEVNAGYQKKLNLLNGQLSNLEQQDSQQGILTQQQKDGLNILKQTQQIDTDIVKAKHEQAEKQKQINTRQQNLGQMLISTIAHYAMYMVAMKLWTGVASSIKDCVNYTKDLNEAMTNIRVVTMDTKEATEGLLDSYNQIGQELGADTLDIAEGAVDWLRQGYSTGDTTELVKDSTILSRLALLDNAEATEYLTSALKGYKLEAQDAIGVIDQLVSIDLEAATSAGDMAEALSRTANMARTTGFEMNEVLGMIATMSEVTQNSASTIGNSVKTILSRMSNVKAGLDDFEGEALNDVEKTLNRVGIALRDNQGNWYDFYDVLDEIASKWDSFTDVQQSQITTALGGKQNFFAKCLNTQKCVA